MKRAAGFTLLEVLASLVLLALLMVGVYAGIHTATHAASSGTALIERVDQVRSAQHFLRRELAQSLAQPIRHDAHGEPVFFEGNSQRMRYIAPLPGYLGKLGPQLQQLELVAADDGEGFRLELSLALLPPDGTAPQSLGDPQVLLDHIKNGSFHYRGVDERGQELPWSSDWTQSRLLPQLVRIKLQPRGRIDWPQLQIPLRVTPMPVRFSRSSMRGAVSRGGMLH